MFVECVPLLVCVAFAAIMYAHFASMLNNEFGSEIRPVAIGGSMMFVFFFFWILYRCIE